MSSDHNIGPPEFSGSSYDEQANWSMLLGGPPSLVERKELSGLANWGNPFPKAGYSAPHYFKTRGCGNMLLLLPY